MRRRSREGRSPLARNNSGPILIFGIPGTLHHIADYVIPRCGLGSAQFVSPVALHFKQVKANVQERLCMPVNCSIIVAVVSAPSHFPPARPPAALLPSPAPARNSPSTPATPPCTHSLAAAARAISALQEHSRILPECNYEGMMAERGRATAKQGTSNYPRLCMN